MMTTEQKSAVERLPKESQSLYHSCCIFGDSHEQAMSRVEQAEHIKSFYGRLPAKPFGQVA